MHNTALNCSDPPWRRASHLFYVTTWYDPCLYNYMHEVLYLKIWCRYTIHLKLPAFVYIYWYVVFNVDIHANWYLSTKAWYLRCRSMRVIVCLLKSISASQGFMTNYMLLYKAWYFLNSRKRTHLVAIFSSSRNELVASRAACNVAQGCGS